MPRVLRKVVEKVKKDEDALAVIAFGSYARNKEYTDIDICVVLKPSGHPRS